MFNLNNLEQNSIYYLLNNNLNFYILQISKAFKFLSASILLQKFFSNKQLIFGLFQFNQNFNFARNIYLNVFNKYQKDSSIMKEQRKNFYLLLIILSLIALFLISCDNKDKKVDEEVKGKRGTEERTLSYYAGNWYGKPDEKTAEMNILTINADSSVILKDGTNPDVTILSNSVTRVSDTNYTTIYNDSSVNIDVKLTLIFSSDKQGKLTMETGTDSAIVDITKK